MTSALAPDGVTTVAIDPRRALGQVDRRIYGGFVEHLGRCIYGGLYEPGSGLSDDRGFRADVLSLLKELRLSVLRWPGGNFVSNYHWIDGVGPRQPASAPRCGLGRDRVQPVRHRRIPPVLRRARGRALHLPEHG